MTPYQRNSALFAFACTEEAPAIVQVLIRYWEMHPEISETDILMQVIRDLSEQNVVMRESLTRLNAVTSSPPIFLEGSAAARLDSDRYDLAALNPYFEDEGPFAGEGGRKAQAITTWWPCPVGITFHDIGQGTP